MGCVALANFIKAKVYTRISNTLRLDYCLFYKIFYITYLLENYYDHEKEGTRK